METNALYFLRTLRKKYKFFIITIMAVIHFKENKVSYLPSHKFSTEILEQLKPLSSSNNYSWIIGLAYDYLMIGIAILASVKLSWYLYPLSIIIIGTRQ